MGLHVCCCQPLLRLYYQFRNFDNFPILITWKYLERVGVFCSSVFLSQHALKYVLLNQPHPSVLFIRAANIRNSGIVINCIQALLLTWVKEL